MIDLYLFRHAESEMNTSPGLIGGRSNWAKLTPEGEDQSKLLGKRLLEEGITFEHVFVSPAKRTKGTAELVCKEVGFPKENITTVDEIQELDQGEWEGKPRKECYTTDMMKLLDLEGWDFKAPGGESRKEVEERMVRFLDSHIIPNYDSSKVTKIAVFSHGIAIKCLLRHILGFDQSMTYKIMLANTSITQLRYSEKGWFVERVNDGAHIGNNDVIDAYQNWVYGRVN